MREHVITAFINGTFGSRGDLVVMAVDEDGFVLASHVSSSEFWARRDIGVGRRGDEQRATWKDERYDGRYPDGWVVEWTSDWSPRRTTMGEANREYADGMRWTCEQAGHPKQHPDDGDCICGKWARHVEAGAVVIDCTEGTP